ncbi:hypothetical protein CDO26_36525 (plasmid) [Sinorhizobium meliloti]|nr:hypothetical protein CDO26_36525 [Sinorhizobium meliloti]
MDNNSAQLEAHLDAQRRAYARANNADVNNFKLTYLYTYAADAVICVNNQNFLGLIGERWTRAPMIPVNGPIGPWNWFLAVPQAWCTANAINDQTLHNAPDFPVVAWGPVLPRQ